MTTTVTFNLSDEEVSGLERMAADAGITRTEVLRYGLCLMDAYVSHVKEGETLLFLTLDRYDKIKENVLGVKVTGFGFEHRLRKK